MRFATAALLCGLTLCTTAPAADAARIRVRQALTPTAQDRHVYGRRFIQNSSGVSDVSETASAPDFAPFVTAPFATDRGIPPMTRHSRSWQSSDTRTVSSASPHYGTSCRNCR